MAEPQPKLSPASADALVGTTVGRLILRRRLGVGGMGEVYLAEDPKLKRQVAVKRMAPQLREDREYRERFMREAERASGVTSPHVAAIYDVLEDGGDIFLVMEYVEGRDLRALMCSAVEPDQFMKIAVQCAEGLISAHRRGILHCDIKPENIMVNADDQVKILDFGVAKKLPQSDQSTTMDRDRSGTPSYMAPEFLLNRPIDGRADIFSLGLVFYEMLAKRHPFRHDSFAGTLDGILREPAPQLRTIDPSISKKLEFIVGKMLAKDPAERYANATELLADLQRMDEPPAPARPRRWRSIAATVAALAIAAVIMVWWLRTPRLPSDKQLAVLPFTSASADASARAFSNGLTETLTTKLVTLTNRYPFQVVPMSEIRAAGVQTAEDARRGFSVNLVLMGTLSESGGMVRVTYVLEDAVTKRSLIGDVITADASDPFAVEDKVVQSILNGLDLQLQGSDREALAKRQTTAPGAYDYYLRGRGYLQENQRPESLNHAIEVFQRALDQDPNYSLAYAGLGEAYWREFENTQDRSWVDKSKQACQHAEALGSELAATHVCIGTVLNGTGQYEQATGEFRRAAELDPTNDDAVRGLAAAYEKLSKPGDAEAAYKQAIAMRPQFWLGYNYLGIFYHNQARYEDAVKQFEQVIQLAPDSYRGYSNLGGTYLALGRYAEAIPKFQQSTEIYPAPFSYSNLATAYFYQKQYADAANTYEKAVKLEGSGFEEWGNLAEAYYWAPGLRDKSSDAYRKAIALAEERLQVNPREGDALAYLGLYHAMLTEPEPALRYMKQALAAAPEDSEVLFLSAKTESQLGNAKSALEYLQKALAAGYSRYYAKDDPVFGRMSKEQVFKILVTKN